MRLHRQHEGAATAYYGGVTTLGIAKADMRELVKDATAVEEIDLRPGMTARHAQRVYGANVARPPDHGVIREMLVDVLR